MAKVTPDKPMYRMPVSFGPTPGPRQAPEGGPFSDLQASRRRSATVTFRSEADQLTALMPPGFTLHGDPLVTIETHRLSNLHWLAGRGYNLLTVKIPAEFIGKRDRAQGPLMVVMWEDLPDAILSGREELGYNKLYCELPEPRVLKGREHHAATWLGHKFLDMWVEPIEEVSPDHPAAPSIGGVMHYKYIPRTGDWGVAETAYAAITPPVPGALRVLRKWNCSGSVEFRKSTWEQLPTQYHVINRLAELENLEIVSASMSEAEGSTDLSEQKQLL